jgi:23S rRNA (adenine2030-N6)-methyltransferase
MNYRHGYHAGNFGDVLKHAVLALVIEHLKKKPSPFRIIDTHAGTGLYDLASVEAQKTGEWRGGIGRLWGETLPPPVAEILAPYLRAVSAENPDGVLARYPGSPRIARYLMRPDDILAVNELHLQDFEELKALFSRDRQTRVLGLDGWVAIKSLLPPKERRGVVLIDPPFEVPGEFTRLVEGLREAVRRFATGTVLLWYPIKEEREALRFQRQILKTGLPKLYSVELFTRPANNPNELSGTGLIILNPPFTLGPMLDVLLPFLAERLAIRDGGGSRHVWLVGDVGSSS